MSDLQLEEGQQDYASEEIAFQTGILASCQQQGKHDRLCYQAPKLESVYQYRLD